jgi:hypothetical protein
MRINIITEQPGWILHRCAQELANRLPDITVNGPRGSGDLTYYMPAYCWTKPEARDPAIGLWTHPTPDRLTRFVGRYRAHVAMNQRIGAALQARGADVVVIRPGAATTPRPMTVGVCGRVYRTGRKGEALVTQMLAAGYRVVAWGSGWPCPIFSGQLSSLASFYRAIDYLVVTSLEEGGPLPVIDALAYRVPVIAPDVGWCWEFPVIRYTRGDWASLEAVLRALQAPPTWTAWAEAHAVLFRRLDEGGPDAIRGASRQ